MALLVENVQDTLVLDSDPHTTYEEAICSSIFIWTWRGGAGATSGPPCTVQPPEHHRPKIPSQSPWP